MSTKVEDNSTSSVVKAFKLKSGEEFIAQVLHDYPDTLTIRNPVAIVYGNNNTEQFVPVWPVAALGGDDIELFHDSLAFAPGDPDNTTLNAYKQLFQIGIITPPKQKILLG